MTEKYTYISVIQAVEGFRETGGEGGCFFELLREIQAKAGVAETLHTSGQIRDGDYLVTMGRLREIVESLPPLQTPEALEAAYEGIDSIELFKPQL